MFGKSLIGCNGGGGGTPPPGTDLTPGLISHYPLKENTHDYYGSNDSGLVPNGVTFNGSAAAVDGVNQYIRFSHDVTLPPFTQTSTDPAFCISWWAKVDTYDSDAMFQWANAVSDGTPYMLLKETTTGFTFYYKGAYNTIAVQPTAGSRVHFAITRDPTTDMIELYVNGNMEWSQMDSNSAAVGEGDFLYFGNGYNNYFDGEFSNVKVYSEYKNSSFITDLYNEGYSPAVATPVGDITTGLIANWMLNNNADDSFGTYHGTVYGAPEFRGDMTFFDGVDDYITFPINSRDTDIFGPDVPTDSGASMEYTLSFWFMPEAAESGQALFIWYDPTNSNFPMIYIRSYGTSVDFYLENNYYSVPYTFTIGQMYLIRIDRDPATFNNKFYIDNILYLTINDNGSLNNHLEADMFAISGGVTYTSNSISNMKLYNRLLSIWDGNLLLTEGYYPKTITPPTTSGLLAYLPLTGTAEDKHGSYDGTEAGNTYIDDLEFGGAASFDGTTSNIKIPSDIILDDGDYTVSFWVYMKSTQTDANSRMITALGTNSNIQIGSFTTGAVYLRQNNASIQTATGALVMNEFSNIIVSYDSVGVIKTITINGIDIATSSGGPTANGTFSAIGAGYAETTYALNGYMRDIRFYNRVLTSQEKSDIYNYEKNFRNIDIDDGLICFYPLGVNSLDNYYNQYDGVDVNVTYDGLSGIFNGTNSSVIVPYNNMTSFSFWFKTTDTGKGFIKTTDTSNPDTQTRSYSADLDTNGSLRFYYYDGGTRQVLTTTSGLNDNIWHYVFLSRNGTTIYIYVDNVLVATHTIIGTLWAAGAYTVIGMGTAEIGGLNGYYINGLISKARFYSNYVSEERIGIIYNEEKGAFGL